MATQIEALRQAFATHLETGDIDAARALLEELKTLQGPMREQLRLATRGKPASLGEAREIMGYYMLGPDSAKRTFGVQLDPTQIPQIPFTPEELERARELDEVLRLPIATDADGSPLSIKHQAEMLTPRFAESDFGKVLQDGGDNEPWYKDEPAYTSEVPRPGWALFTKTPYGLGRGALSELRTFSSYMAHNLFPGRELPAAYREVCDELASQVDALEAWMEKNPGEATRLLCQLGMNDFRRNAPEAFSDTLAYHEIAGVRLLDACTYDRTSSRARDGTMFGVGAFRRDGMWLRSNDAGYADDWLGAVFARRG